ncbi:MAG: hypothetical protein JSR91_24125 [Proteobacteria bacterium]|nr:hypothetical protein [Pseudomonadota bacterium]
MKRSAALVLIAFFAAGCVHGSSMDQVHAGMTHEQVSAVMGGPPDLTTNTAGRECARYTVLKDFWSRVPWDMSDPYYVCYTNGKVDSFGRATVANPS